MLSFEILVLILAISVLITLILTLILGILIYIDISPGDIGVEAEFSTLMPPVRWVVRSLFVSLNSYLFFILREA
jgi:hypothetical protein